MANNTRFVPASNENNSNYDRDIEKAKGFLNIAVEFDDGEVYRLGKKGIPMLESDPVMNYFIMLFEENPEMAQQLADSGKIRFTYTSNNKEKKAASLSFTF